MPKEAVRITLLPRSMERPFTLGFRINPEHIECVSKSNTHMRPVVARPSSNLTTLIYRRFVELFSK